MTNGITSGVKQDTKKIARDIAKRVAQEPLEILRAATRQVKHVELPQDKKEQPSVNSANAGNQTETKTPDPEKLHAQSKRLIDALNREIEDIRRQKKEEEQKKLYEEAQIVQAENEEAKKATAAPMPQGKRPRGLFAGMKAKIKDLTGTTKAEIRKGPTG